MVHNGLQLRDSSPYGVTWEKWASTWCIWQLSMPKNGHPAIDNTGIDCARNQYNKYAWFLTGTFGNPEMVVRTCRIPREKAILFPIIYKEDSFAEDPDLNSESELMNRAKEFADRVLFLLVTIDEEGISNLREYRVRSELFHLGFPENNVYDLKPCITRSVCDGYWVFLKPLPEGEHRIHFTGIASMPNNDIVTQQVINDSIYAPFHKYLEKYSRFKVDVLYELKVS